MAGHPGTPEAGAATDPADASVDGHGYQFGRGVDQPDYASPLAFRLVWSCCSSHFGDPKGDILRTWSAIGFNSGGTKTPHAIPPVRAPSVLPPNSSLDLPRFHGRLVLGVDGV